MPRTDDASFVDFPAGQASARVRAGVVDGVNPPLIQKHGQLKPADLDILARSRRLSKLHSDVHGINQGTVVTDSCVVGRVPGWVAFCSAIRCERTADIFWTIWLDIPMASPTTN